MRRVVHGGGDIDLIRVLRHDMRDVSMQRRGSWWVMVIVLTALAAIMIVAIRAFNP